MRIFQENTSVITNTETSIIIMPDRFQSWCVKMLTTYLCILLAAGRVLSSDGGGGGGSSSSSGAPNPLTDSRGGRIGRGQNLHSLPVIENGTFFIPDIDSYTNTQLYALLVDILEKLNVLVPKAPSCYRLQKIVREAVPQDRTPDQQPADSPQTLIGVYLYFKESALASSGSGDTKAESSDKGGETGKDSADDPKVTPTAKANNECVSEPHFIQTMDAQPLVRDSQADNDTHERRGAPGVGGSGAGEGKNGTRKADTGPQMGPNGEFQRNDDEEDDEDDRFGGLSRTQVVVISTCSAIISTFFIVAFVLRVRNYLKRVREEQQQARRPMFRSCSVRLRSVSHSNEQVRRDSQVSKLSHQSNLTGRNGAGGGGGGAGSYSLTNGSCNNSRDHSNASSPQHDPDTKPLLLVTAVTENPLPSHHSPPHTLHHHQSPSASQSSSLQYIDEESRNRKTERGAVSRTLSGGDDSEARPLLASSEVSANSLHLSPTSPTSIPTSSSLVSHDSPSGGGITPSDLILTSEADPSGGEPTPGLVDLCGPKDGGGGESGRPGDVSSDPVPEASDRRTPPSSAVLQDAVNNPSAVVEVGDNLGEDTHRVGTAADDSEGGGPMPLIHFCGLTQSDTSLSSVGGNQNYCYGTQTEYSPPDQGYYSAVDYINGMNAPYHALRFLHNPTWFSPRSYIPSNYPYSIGDSSPPTTPGPDSVVRGGQGRFRSVDFTKQDSLMSDYGWYDYGSIYSPPPLSANADSVFADLPGAMISDSAGPGLQQPSQHPPAESAVLPNNNSHDCAASVNRVCAASESNGQQVCVGGETLSDVCDSKSKEEPHAKCVAAVCASPDASLESKTEPPAAKDAHASSPSPVSQTLAGGKESPLSPLNRTSPTNNHCDQSGARLESADHLSNQWNASTQSGVADGEQKHGDGVDQSCLAPSSPSSNTPETTVVMKRLLSSEEERTTFL